MADNESEVKARRQFLRSVGVALPAAGALIGGATAKDSSSAPLAAQAPSQEPQAEVPIAPRGISRARFV